MNKQTLLYVVLAAAVVSTVYFSTQETKDEFGMWKKKFNFQFP